MAFRKVKTAALSAIVFGATISAAMADGLCQPVYFAVRSDFNDLAPYGCPAASTQHAQGALLSETYNALTGQNSASIDGLVAVAHQFFSTDGDSGLVTGVFVQGDGTYQYQPTPTQAHTSDTLTEGGFAQFGIANKLLEPQIAATDYFRIRGGETEATIGYNAATFVAEWIPHYKFNNEFAFGYARYLGALGYTFSPEVMVQYDEFLNGSSKPALFSSDNRALRVGPQIVLTSWIQSPDGISPELAKIIDAMSAMLTFHESWDTYTDKNYRWVLASLSYNVAAPNNSGAFGVTVSYGYGNSEVTGALTSQAKLGFSYKY